MTHLLAITRQSAALFFCGFVPVTMLLPAANASDGDRICTNAPKTTKHSLSRTKEAPLSHSWLRWCPDDFCPKSVPCIPSLRSCFGCDDYCSKPAPTLCWPRTHFCPDDFCRKELPYLCWPASPWMRCSPCESTRGEVDYMKGK